MRGVEDRADLHPAEPEARVGADDARAHRHDGGVGAGDVAGDGQRREDRHRLVVAAERVAARDGGVDQPRGAQVRDEVGQRERQPGAVGHHVREAAVRARGRVNAAAHRGHLAVQRRRDHRHAVDRLDLGQRLEVLLGAPDVGLEARVAALDDVAGPGFAPLVAREVPVHDVPAAGAEAELDRGGVHHDVVAQRRPGR